MTINVLAAAKALERAGMENGHAEAIAIVVRGATADLATKADLNTLEDRLNEKLDSLEGRLEAKLANAVNRMLLGNLAVAGLLFAALKLFD